MRGADAARVGRGVVRDNLIQGDAEHAMSTAPDNSPTPSPEPKPIGVGDEVFDLAPEVAVPKTKAPPKPALSNVVEVDTDVEDDGDEVPEPPQGEPLVPVTLVSWKRWGGAGVALTLLATALAFRDEPLHKFLQAFLVLYYAPLGTVLGVGAGFAMATLEQRRLGNWRELAARMLASVAAGLVFLSMNLPIPGKVEETLLAAGAYFGMMMVLMGWPAQRTARLASMHFILMVLIAIPVVIARWETTK